MWGFKLDILVSLNTIDTLQGWNGESCQWHDARESSFENHVFKDEVPGSPKVSKAPSVHPILLCSNSSVMRSFIVVYCNLYEST